MLRNVRELKPCEWVIEKVLESKNTPSPEERSEIIIELRGIYLAVEDILKEEENKRAKELINKISLYRDDVYSFLTLAKYTHNYLMSREFKKRV